jgi:guanylate kinase
VTVVSSNYYGTSIEAVEAVALTGKTCILDIEMEAIGLFLQLVLTAGRPER